MIAYIERLDQRLTGPFDTIEGAMEAWMRKYSNESLHGVQVAEFKIYYDFGQRFVV